MRRKGERRLLSFISQGDDAAYRGGKEKALCATYLWLNGGRLKRRRGRGRLLNTRQSGEIVIAGKKGRGEKGTRAPSLLSPICSRGGGGGEGGKERHLFTFSTCITGLAAVLRWREGKQKNSPTIFN